MSCQLYLSLLVAKTKKQEAEKESPVADEVKEVSWQLKLSYFLNFGSQLLAYLEDCGNWNTFYYQSHGPPDDY
jgi:hypothetical protein